MLHPCIYKIENKLTKKIYIGSALEEKNRWRVHRHHLRKNKHHSILLQRAWNKYGEIAFEFSIIEEVYEIDKLIEREQYWMDYYDSSNPQKGYNVNKIAGNRLGMHHTEETKEKLRVANGYPGRNDFLIGRHLSKETKDKISASNKGKHSSQICINGHDKDIVGRNTQGVCNICYIVSHRKATKKYDKKMRNKRKGIL